MDSFLGQTCPIVPKDKLLARLDGNRDAPTVPTGLLLFAQGDCVHSVLQKLPYKNIGAFIQMVGQDIQHTAKIDLKVIAVFVVRGCLGDGCWYWCFCV